MTRKYLTNMICSYFWDSSSLKVVLTVDGVVWKQLILGFYSTARMIRTCLGSLLEGGERMLVAWSTWFHYWRSPTPFPPASQHSKHSKAWFQSLKSMKQRQDPQPQLDEWKSSAKSCSEAYLGERAFSSVSGGGVGGGGGFIMLDFQARAPKRISQTYHHAKYSSAVYLVR